jgi:hypothetical protein
VALLLAALLRMGGRLVEYALVTVVASFMFIGSSECPVRRAEDANMNPAAYALVVISAAALLWTWVVRLMWGPIQVLDERSTRAVPPRDSKSDV